MISLHKTPLLFVILPCTHLFAKMRFPLCVFFAAATCLIQAQGIHLGSNTPADSSAVVEISSTTAGFLLPRMTTAQRNAIANPAAALQIYNTSTNCLEMYYSGGGWRSIHCDCQAYPNAIFSVPSGYINQGANFSAPPNMTYSWTFQSGSPSTSVVQSPQVSWSNAGTYAVSLTLTDSAGCSSAHTDSITVINCAPATGGSVSTSGPWTIHTFSNNGTFNPGCGRTVQYLIVAGGGGGSDGNAGGGGGGAGGFVEGSILLSPGNYTVVVGAGGVGSTVQDGVGQNGANSSFANIVAVGGGRGGGYVSPNGANGGSGGGGGGPQGPGQGGNATQTSPQSGNGYGFSGAAYMVNANDGGGGGGAGGAATNRNGGPGRASTITGSSVAYGGGGGGARYLGSAGLGGSGGGGNGGSYPGNGNGQNGQANTGGGGGGSGDGPIGGNGGSGIVVVRYQ